MAENLQGKLVVAISSRALFDFEEENRLFETGDEARYMHYQLEHVRQSPGPGVAFALVKKLLAFNTDEVQRVEVVMLSRNDPASGLRVFASAQAAGMRIERGVFTRGEDPFAYLRPLGAHLFLSANAEDVQQALSMGYPAARVLTESRPAGSGHPHEVRIAFDGDAVLFSDEAERVYQDGGLPAFLQHETQLAATPLPEGPFKPLLVALCRLQQQAQASQTMRIRTALVTARSAPAHERAVRTLLEWGITVDEAMFLGGLEKGPFLREFEPDFFFDDQRGHAANAAAHVPSGHVNSGITNAAGAGQKKGQASAPTPNTRKTRT